MAIEVPMQQRNQRRQEEADRRRNEVIEKLKSVIEATTDNQSSMYKTLEDVTRTLEVNGLSGDKAEVLQAKIAQGSYGASEELKKQINALLEESKQEYEAQQKALKRTKREADQTEDDINLSLRKLNLRIQQAKNQSRIMTHQSCANKRKP